ncbi:ComEC/Rec2 family competence protein [Sediminibacterium sp. TEGAF015]|uniref:ComEC/Rec2 family competence protein n=1 Tax=Sediminibacterium sp. TEGAF015 TaxID=575378 RepID=UPI002231523D|nr:ComEC/Rec2 family competence protein [Sediminibacterium sp. TEGAF015]
MAKIYTSQRWWQFPMIRITLALITGLLLGKFVVVPNGLIVTVFTISSLLWLFNGRSRLFHFFKRQWMTGLSVQLLFICAGIILHKQSIPAATPISNKVVLLETPIKKANSYQALAAMHKTKLLIYFNVDIPLDSLNEGMEIQLFKKPTVIVSVTNPGGFDFKQYAAAQHIFHQVYLTKKDYRITSQHPFSITSSLLQKARQYVLHTLYLYIKSNRERGVAEALLIGYKAHLDKTLMNAYSNTGVIHIIAISGLHLGMIYSLLLLLFKPIRRLKQFSWIRTICILFFLWGFALLTGAGASVLRAAVMFSFLLLGEQQNRPHHQMNSLAGSAFCLLLFRPDFLWDIGFQLSYAAVLGILFFARPIEKLIFLKNKLLQLGWQMCSITLGAQILTLPLLLYYFHSFPNLFLIANWIAIPVSGLILYLLIGLLLLAPFSIIASPLGTCIDWLLSQLNQLIEKTASLPFALTEYIQISGWQMLLLFACIISLYQWLLHTSKVFFFIAASTLLFIVGIHTIDTLHHRHQKKIIIYHTPKHSAIDIMEGLGHQFLGDSAFNFNPVLVNQVVKPGRTLYRTGKSIRPVSVALQKPFIISRNKVILIAGPQLPFPDLATVPIVDLIVITGSRPVPMKAIAKYFPATLLVFDSSTPLWKIQKWKKEAERLHLRHYSVPEKGAFEYNL